MRKAIIQAIALTLALALGAGIAAAANELIVSELMYNSIEDDDVEWIELYNNSEASLDLTGWYVLDNNFDHTKMYLSGAMYAGDVMVLVGTEALFTAKYPGVTNYFPVFFQEEGDTWALGNGGDGVNIYNALGELVFTMEYDDASPWPTSCDGDGPSLVLTNLGCGDYSDASCWIEGEIDGSPGILAETVSTDELSWDGVKSLYR